MDDETKTKQQLIEELAALRQRLADANRQVAESEKVQSALYRIASAISAAEDMPEVYAVIHRIVGELLQPQAFLIALYDETTDLVSFPYQYDEVTPDAPAEPGRLSEGGGFTGQVIRTGRPLLLSHETALEMVQQGEGQISGAVPESAIFVPLKRDHQTFGVLSVQSYTRRYDEQDEALLTFVSQHIAFALERARLLEDTRQRLAELDIIENVGQALVRQLDFQAVIDLVGDRVGEIFAAQTLYIALYDKQTNMVRFPYFVDGGQRVHTEPLELGAGLTSIVIQSRQPLVIGTEQQSTEHGAIIEGAPAQSYLGVPIVVGDDVIGVISVQDEKQENLFTDSDVRLLATLAASLGVAIENTRLFQETNRLLEKSRQHASELTTVNRIGQALASQLDIDALIELVGEQIRQTFNAQVAYVALYDRQTDLIHFPYDFDGQRLVGTSLEFGQGLTSKIIERGQPLLINQDVQQHYDEFDAETLGTLPKSYLGVPITAGDEIIGVVSVQSTEEEGRFDEDDLHLLSTIAANIGVAIRNAQLYQEAKRRADEMAALAEVAHDISATHDLVPVLERIAVHAKDLLQVRDVTLYLQGADEQTFHVVIALGLCIEEIKTSPIMLGEGIMGHIAQSGTAEVINYPEQDPRAKQVTGTPSPEEGEQEAMMCAPLHSHGKVIGVMTLWRPHAEGLFSQSDLDFLVNLARQASIAIESARLFGETRRRVAELATLTDVGQALSSTLRIDEVLRLIYEQARRVIYAENMIIMFYDQVRHEIECVFSNNPDDVAPGVRLPAETGLTGYIVQHRKSVLLRDNVVEGIRELGLEIVGQPSASWLGVPMLMGERVLGVIIVQHYTTSNVYDESHQVLLETIGSQAAIAIENAHLFEEVQRSKQYFESLVLNSPVAIVVGDTDHKIVSWNPAAEEMFGYARDEAIGHSIDDLVAADHGSQDEAIREEAVAYSQQIMRGNAVRAITRRSGKDGTMMDVELFAVPLLVEGEHVGNLAIYHDITELQRARQEAEAANRAKSAFLATMSHEIRTPMNGVIGMASLLLDTDLTPEQGEFVETIRQSGDALLAIINDILDFSKIEAGRMDLERQPFDLRDCVAGSLDLLATKAADKELELACLVDDRVPIAILGDVTRLRQIMVNLLDNAIKFTERGEVVVSVDLCPPQPTSPPATESTLPSPPLGGTEGGKYELHFAVRDTGIGIPPDRMDRLFRSFSQVDSSMTRRYGGTGLGLAISKRLSELMGGTMWVESKAGVGTTIHFTIQTEAAHVPAPAYLQGAQPDLKGRRVLIVDDNATNRRILTLQTQSWGMEPVATASPAEALEWIRRDDPFDVAILDMQMPEMDGLMLAEEIRRIRDAEALPLVMLTSLGCQEIGAGEDEFSACLTKPVRASQLYNALVDVFAREMRPGQERAGLSKPQFDPEMGQRLPLRILLAEDNAINQKLVLRLLERMGYRADLAANGLEVLEALRRQPYDVVLMDVQMPEMDGLEATRTIYQEWPPEQRPRIIAMTANAMKEDREACLAAGMADYISKPIRVDELVRTLNRCQPLP